MSDPAAAVAVPVTISTHPGQDRSRTARQRLGSTLVVLAAASLLAACTDPTPTTDASTVVPTAMPGGQIEVAQTDVMSPLIITALTPDPIPVRGADERFHAAYELTVLNFSPRPATITDVEILAPDGSVLSALTSLQVAERTMIVADYAPPAPQDDGTPASVGIPSGKTALLVLDVTAATRAELPASVSHRISATFGPAETGAGGIAVLWADTATQTGGEVVLSTEEPVVIGAPLSGAGWLVSAGCCTLNVHRNVILPVGGRINGGERYALDLSRIDVDAVRANGFDPSATVDGDAARNEDHLACGAPVLAVADGTVVTRCTAPIPTPSRALCRSGRGSRSPTSAATRS